MSLTIGQPFPRLTVPSAAGSVDLAERWARGPLVVAFHRLWCPFCQEAALQLAARASDLAAVGADVVLVYPQAVAEVAQACAERSTPFTCVSDPGRTLEQAAGVERMRATRYLAGASPRRLARALRGGGRVHLPTSDVFQGRGTYVVGTDGRVAYAHIAASASDIPPVATIVAAVQALAAGAPARPVSPAVR